MTDQTLLALAERVEQASGPDRDLDAEIAVTISGDKAAWVVVESDDSIFAHIPGWWRDGEDKSHDAPHYTASLDAAMTLVPEGYGWRLWMPAASQEGDMPRVTVWGPSRSYAPNDTEGRTPALALCAAALRAQAIRTDKEGA